MLACLDVLALEVRQLVERGNAIEVPQKTYEQQQQSEALAGCAEMRKSRHREAERPRLGMTVSSISTEVEVEVVEKRRNDSDALQEVEVAENLHEQATEPLGDTVPKDAGEISCWVMLKSLELAKKVCSRFLGLMHHADPLSSSYLAEPFLLPLSNHPIAFPNYDTPLAEQIAGSATLAGTPFLRLSGS